MVETDAKKVLSSGDHLSMGLVYCTSYDGEGTDLGLPKGISTEYHGDKGGGHRKYCGGYHSIYVAVAPGESTHSMRLEVWRSGEGWLWDGPWVGLVEKWLEKCLKATAKNARKYKRIWEEFQDK